VISRINTVIFQLTNQDSHVTYYKLPTLRMEPKLCHDSSNFKIKTNFKQINSCNNLKYLTSNPRLIISSCMLKGRTWVVTRWRLTEFCFCCTSFYSPVVPHVCRQVNHTSVYVQVSNAANEATGVNYSVFSSWVISWRQSTKLKRTGQIKKSMTSLRNILTPRKHRKNKA